ncbi:MAG: 23S rRNA (uridine(2552)-2'-O)-methyltransferase RlmE [Xanthomonadaceae bacterium]|nr:23S rRNA (uridine(2552)-2'-O)-methyltransferase RlmE [Xanthomonadaceae bacterium]
MAKRSKSSRQWLTEHFDDAFVKRAQAEGWRSRAVYKLIEIDERDHLIRPGMNIVDLGAAPGGWAQYAARKLGGRGRVIALDILEMPPLDGVEVLLGDFREDTVLEELRRLLAGAQVDLVMSDMAPNISGMAAVDQPRSMYLAELALAFARETLKPGGDLLTKVFQGEGYEAFVQDLKQDFATVTVRKPKASRPRSREVYLLARNHRA